MSKITVKTIEYSTFGKCLEISNGIVKVVATVDIGPRIINYSFVDGENIFFEDTRQEIANTNPAIEVFGKGCEFRIRGGHRLWTSPEAMPRTYYPDNEPISYEITDNGVILVPPQQRWTQLQLKMQIELSEDSTDVTVNHFVTNKNAFEIEQAVWSLSVASQGGLEVIPQPTENTGLLSNRQIALWSYTHLSDERAYWSDKYIYINQNPTIENPYKLGIRLTNPTVFYFNHGDLFIKRFDSNPDGVYPDGGMNYETYTNHKILEIESLGELKNIAPDQTITHKEYWSLHKEDMPEKDDAVMDRLLAKYAK